MNCLKTVLSEKRQSQRPSLSRPAFQRLCLSAFSGGGPSEQENSLSKDLRSVPLETLLTTCLVPVAPNRAAHYLISRFCSTDKYTALKPKVSKRRSVLPNFADCRQVVTGVLKPVLSFILIRAHTLQRVRRRSSAPFANNNFPVKQSPAAFLALLAGEHV